MSGRWAIFNYGMLLIQRPPRDLFSQIVVGVEAHLSAMTVKYGDKSMYDTLRAKLGEDPLDPKADVEKLRQRVKKLNKTISKLLMDQAYFCGVGNIYRAEILFVRMYPEVKGCNLSDEEFDRVWKTSVKLMKAGFKTAESLP